MALSKVYCGLENLGKNGFAFVEELTVGEPKNGTAERAEVGIPVFVMDSLQVVRVNRPIELDDEVQPAAVEIHDENADWGLTAELDSRQTAIPQDLPH